MTSTKNLQHHCMDFVMHSNIGENLVVIAIFVRLKFRHGLSMPEMTHFYLKNAIQKLSNMGIT